MTHATEGLLQAYLDEEIEGSAAAELRDHLAGCAACRSELEALQRAGEQVHVAMAALAPAGMPMLRARSALATARRGAAIEDATAPVTAHRSAGRPTGRPGGRWSLTRLGASGLAKAAMLLLALAGAGAAAIPGSPVRRALETTFARVAQLFNGAPAEQVVVPESPVAPPVEPVPSRMAVLPAEGRVRIVIERPAAEVDVVVRIVDEPLAQVDAATADDGVRFRTGPGRIEVSGLSAGVITVDVPRTVRTATVEVDGTVLVEKQADMLQLSGPAGRERGDQVRFRIGT
ncbi:MAG TPA: zf-HC2 domain-containing protein [Longimicrobiales bacterium]|nr:zf-HC2 domain-containing protein [Longimicrobiales bacterium]